jgi:hypothetical protein
LTGEYHNNHSNERKVEGDSDQNTEKINQNVMPTNGNTHQNIRPIKKETLHSNSSQKVYSSINQGIINKILKS